MIVVRVELHSAITGRISELARMTIANKGDEINPNIGNYDIKTIRGRSSRQLDDMIVNRKGTVLGHRRLDLHVWYLVAKALKVVGYNDK